jgi:hypothetical protein
MQPLPRRPLKAAIDEVTALNYVTSFATGLCQTISQIPIDTRRMRELCQRFETTLSLDEKAVGDVVKRALQDAKDYGALVNSSMQTTQVFRVAEAWSTGDEVTDSVDAVSDSRPGGARFAVEPAQRQLHAHHQRTHRRP